MFQNMCWQHSKVAIFIKELLSLVCVEPGEIFRLDTLTVLLQVYGVKKIFALQKPMAVFTAFLLYTLHVAAPVVFWHSHLPAGKQTSIQPEPTHPSDTKALDVECAACCLKKNLVFTTTAFRTESAKQPVSFLTISTIQHFLIPYTCAARLRGPPSLLS